MIWSNPLNGHSQIVWLRACGWYEMALVDVLEIIDDDSLKQKINNLIKNQLMDYFFILIKIPICSIKYLICKVKMVIILRHLVH